MSATGEAPSDCRQPPAGGFTLIEMLVILGVLALVAALMFPSVDKAMRGQMLAASTAKVELALRGARADAVRTGRAVRFDAGSVDRLPETTRITLSGASIAFYPDGSTSGGRVTLSDGPLARRIDVRAPTGAVSRVN